MQISITGNSFNGGFYTLYKLEKSNAFVIVVNNEKAKNQNNICIKCKSEISSCSNTKCECPCLGKPSYDYCKAQQM